MLLLGPLTLQAVFEGDDDPDPVTQVLPIDWLTPAPSKQSTPKSKVAEDDKLVSQLIRPFGKAMEEEKKVAEEEKFLLSFNNLSIVEVLRFISKISGKNFIFDEEDMQFNVTIVSQEPASVSDIMAALLQVLRIRGLTMLEQGNNIVIHSNKTVQRIPRLVGEGIEDRATDETELVTRVYRLNNLSVEKASALIKPLLSKDSLIETLPETHHIVLTDFVGNIQRVTRLFEEIDKPTVRAEIGQYLVRNREINSLIELTRELMAPVVGEQPFSLIPSTVSNSIFVVSTPFLVERTLAMLQTLDLTARQTRIINVDSIKVLPTDDKGRLLGPDGQGLLAPERENLFEGRPEDSIRLDSRLFGEGSNLSPDEDAAEDLFGQKKPLPKRFRIHKLHHRKADALAESLSLIADSLENAESDQDDLVLALRSIQSITETNSLVFTGVEAATAEVLDLIEQLDKPTRQVFIELLIFQTSILNSLQFGVDWRASIPSGTKSFGLGSQNIRGGSQVPTSGDITAVDGLITPTGLAAATVGRYISYKGETFVDFGAVIRALEEQTSTQIVMNPKILVQDGVTAEVFVGENRPFQTTTTTVEGSTNTESTFEYRDIGSRVTVTPFIGEGEFITLEIDQEISSDTGEQEEQTENVQNLATSTLKTTTTTTVHVPSGHFVALSGQIRETRTYTKTGIPCLGTLPLIGHLFSYKEISDPEKSNLMIFIRPTVVDTAPEIRRLTRDQQNLMDRKSIESLRPGRKDRLHDSINGYEWSKNESERWKYKSSAYEWLNPGACDCGQDQ